MEVLKKLYSGDATTDEQAEEIQLVFWCPGCQTHHSYRIKGREPVWQWNGDITKPTFSPSLMVNGSRPESRCHLFLREGKIEFLNDCFHDLKGQVLPLEECQW